jgi:hypothetical protein
MSAKKAPKPLQAVPASAISPAQRDERCSIAADAAIQIEGLSSTLRALARRLDLQDSEHDAAALLALANRNRDLSQAIYCLLDDPNEPTEGLRDIVTGDLEAQS